MTKHRIAATALAIALTAAGLMLAGCQINKDGQASAAARIYEPGTYAAQAMGLGGPVEVKITVDAARIKTVEILASKETESIGGAAIQTMRENILASQGAEVDVISGATRTCEAVKEALGEALAKARGEQKKAAVLADGKYVTKIMGHEGYVNVSTVFRGGAIESCKVISHEETMGIGNYAAARIPGRIVKAQSLAVDSVSGATVTSSAIKVAVAQAIKDAGGDLAAFQKAPEQAPVVAKKVERKVDVVIAGAGTAGLMAGARLVEQGKTVLIFEKQDIPGGAMPMTYGGIQSAGSAVGAAYGQGREKNDASWSKDLILGIYKKMIRPQYDRFNKAQPYKTAQFEASGPMVDWMREIGVGFAPMGKYEGSLQLGLQPYMAPGCYQGGAGYAAMTLADRIVAKGGTIIYGTPVVSLKMGQGGRVVGLKAEGKDGSSWDVDAGAVLLATGGFASNRDMLAKYYPAYKDFAFNGVAGDTGEGIVMGQAAGAAIECMDRALGAFPSAYGSNYELAFINMVVPGILVAGEGSTVADASHVGIGNARLDPANKDRFFYVFDEEGVEAMKKSMNYGFSYASVFERGEAVKYASVKEASDKLGLPKLASVIAENNANALAKKGKASYVETRDGVWLIRITPCFYLTTGGLAIDTKAQVLDGAGKAIPGLYAAGDVAGSIEEKDGLVYGYGFPAALTYGYIAAQTIAKDK